MNSIMALAVTAAQFSPKVKVVPSAGGRGTGLKLARHQPAIPSMQR